MKNIQVAIAILVMLPIALAAFHCLEKAVRCDAAGKRADAATSLLCFVALCAVSALLFWAVAP